MKNKVILTSIILLLSTINTFAQATLQVKATGEVQMDYNGTNILELRDGSTLKGYIQHDGTNFKFYNNEPGTVILGTNNTNRLYIANSGNVKIGGGAPDSKAILDIAGSGKGLLIPRTDTSAFLGSVTEGMLIYDTSMSKFAYYDGSHWVAIGTYSELSDIDNDTKILVEQSPDEDTIRFIIEGMEHFRMDAGGHLEVLNTGRSVFIGEGAGINANNTSSVGIGYKSLNSNISKSGNTAVGNQALRYNRGLANTAFGNGALKSNLNANYNTAIGNASLVKNLGGYSNTAVGSNSMNENTYGNMNIGIGASSLYSNMTGNENVAVGIGAMTNCNNGSYNSSHGSWSLWGNESGSHNVAIGYKSAYTSTDVNNLVAIGDSSLFYNTAAYQTAVGAKSLLKNSTGEKNIAMGQSALHHNTIGNQNNAFGYKALSSNIDGDHNIAMGTNALRDLSVGDGNIAIGVEALADNVGSHNVAIGHESGESNTGSDNIFLGYRSGMNETGNQKLYIENTDSSSPLIYGEFDNNLVKINGTIHVNDVIKLEPRATIPTSPTEGTMYFDSGTLKLRVYDGTNWQDCW